MQVGRLGETQQFFKCKNSAILCKVNAKVCKKVQEKSLLVCFNIQFEKKELRVWEFINYMPNNAWH